MMLALANAIGCGSGPPHPESRLAAVQSGQAAALASGVLDTLGATQSGQISAIKSVVMPWASANNILYLSSAAVTTSGSSVTGMIDSRPAAVITAYGAQNNFSQSNGAKQPTLVGGRVRFASSGAQQLDSASDITAADGTTIMVVGTSLGAGVGIFFVTHSLVVYDNIASTRWGGYNNAALDSGAALSTTPRIMVMVTRTANDVDFYTDDTGPTTRTNGTSYNARGTKVGGLNAQYLDGEICEVLMWSRALTTDEIAAQVLGIKERLGIA
jgi:hypothetical protein